MGMEKVWIYGYRVGKGMEKGDGMGMEMGRWGKYFLHSEFSLKYMVQA